VTAKGKEGGEEGGSFHWKIRETLSCIGKKNPQGLQPSKTFSDKAREKRGGEEKKSHIDPIKLERFHARMDEGKRGSGLLRTSHHPLPQ